MRLTREQAEAIYDLGKEAVVQFMLETDARLRELERRLNMDSSNSSKPPSSDSPFDKKQEKEGEPTLSITQIKKQKKRGGQKGKEGKTLKMNPHPDQIQILLPTYCKHCHKSLEATPTTSTPWRRQVIDLPKIRLHTTEYQSFAKACPCCGTKSHGTFPAHAPSRIQFGPNLTAFVSYLSAHQMAPHERISEMLGDLCHQRISVGAVDAMLTRGYQALGEAEETIREHLLGEEVLHSDETGINISGELHWLHNVSSQNATLYAPHAKRGREGIESAGVLPEFQGILVHDHWSSYLHYKEATHAFCNAHILRELQGVIEHEALSWAKETKGLLRTMNQVVKRAKAQGRESLSSPQISKFHQAWSKITQAALGCYDPPPRQSGKRGRIKQPKGKNLLDRLITYKEETLRFLSDFRVPFDNNLAERDLRMTKVKLKISGCFMSDHGAKRFARIRGYISTLRKNGEPILERLKEALVGPAYVPAVVRGG